MTDEARNEGISEAQLHAERLLREALAAKQPIQTGEQIAAELGIEERLRKALAEPIDRLERLSRH
jgi:hypothetical protein